MIPDTKELSLKHSPDWSNSVVALTTTDYALTAEDLGDVISVKEIHVRCGVEFQYRRTDSSPWVIEAAGTWVVLALANPVTPILLRTTAGTGSLEVKAFGLSLTTTSQAPGTVISPLTIQGYTYKGYTLTVKSPSVYSRTPSSRQYQWYRGGVAIAGANGTSYVADSPDEDQEITCIETGKFGSASAQSTSNTLHYWTPQELGADLLAWYDPTDLSKVIEVAGRISQVTNRKTGGTVHLIQGAGSAQPRMRTMVNALNAIECDSFGKSMGFDGLGITTTQEFSLLVVTSDPYAYSSPTSGRIQISGSSGGRYCFTTTSTGTNDLVQRPSAGTLGASPTLPELPGISLWSHEKDVGTNTDLCYSYRNGATVPSGYPSNAISVYASDNRNRLNAVSTTGNRGTCTYCEVVAVNRRLTNTEREKWWGYSAWKHRAVDKLPDDHPYKNFPPEA